MLLKSFGNLLGYSNRLAHLSSAAHCRLELAKGPLRFGTGLWPPSTCSIPCVEPPQHPHHPAPTCYRHPFPTAPIGQAAAIEHQQAELPCSSMSGLPAHMAGPLVVGPASFGLLAQWSYPISVRLI
jgi:hypothetical protein